MRQTQTQTQTPASIAKQPVQQCKNVYYLNKGWLNLILKAAHECGLDIDNYLSKHEIEHIGVDVRKLRKVHEQMMKDSGKEDFSIIAAKHVNPLTFDSYSLMLWTAPDVNTLLQVSTRYAISVGGSVHLNLSYNWRGDAEIWFVSRDPMNSESAVSYVGMTLFMVVFMQILYQTLGSDQLGLAAELVNWPYQAYSPEEFGAMINCKISVGSPVRKLIIPRRVLHRPLLTTNSEVYYAIRPVVIKRAATAMEEDIVLQIYRWLDEHSSLANIDIKALASSFSVSVRTLNRRLAGAGTTYRYVSENYKLERALHWLSVEGLSVTDVAYRLGFADLSTFSRAFKRWTGRSPSHLSD
ncbi:helix-turn-helix domain-containing protein [Thalassotalea euphylliae]|uniref:AraC family transcriptional regulator n=1 Tax=Thalassotalea euphylliae TaxID=1655234 RepID=A0A3E0TZB7_9GAMM|nr:AraC family transcriptional regulator [Thalassotalea euphylliae]REL29804.1 AraC family transcriptional regulator [Thalassotalea euphylliae]